MSNTSTSTRLSTVGQVDLEAAVEVLDRCTALGHQMGTAETPGFMLICVKPACGRVAAQSIMSGSWSGLAFLEGCAQRDRVCDAL